MNENIKNLKFKLIMENNDGLSKKKHVEKQKLCMVLTLYPQNLKQKIILLKILIKVKK